MSRWCLEAVIVLALLTSACSDDPTRGNLRSEQELFQIVGAESGFDFRHDNGARGEMDFYEIMGSGGALFDYDGDGDLDIYAVQGGHVGQETTAGDRLYRNDLSATGGESRWVDVTHSAGLRTHPHGVGVAVADLDNDGWLDLYSTRFGANVLWLNRGDGTFVDATARAGVDDPRWSVSATFFDYDRDGWLDLYVTNYVTYRATSVKRCQAPSGRLDYCGPRAFSPESDRLFRNLGDGTFADVSGPAGILASLGNGLGVVATDHDGDGWPDLYVANDQQTNVLWRNRSDGTFADDAFAAGLAVNGDGLAEASMGIAAGDVDNDGDEDLFVAHLAQETSTLYLNQADGFFVDGTRRHGLAAATLPFTGFGSAFLDFDLDGDVDLLTVNGAVRRLDERTRQGDSFPFGEPDQLFLGQGVDGFADVSHLVGGRFGAFEASRGAAVGDVDADGDEDFLIFRNGAAAALYRRAGTPETHWVGIVPLARGTVALGAVVTVFDSGGIGRRRVAHADGSYASSHDPRVVVGLGAESVTAVHVSWPTGGQSRFLSPPTDHVLVFPQRRVHPSR